MTLFSTKHNFFKNSFFPSSVIEWNKLDPNFRNATSLNLFKKDLLKFIRPSPNVFLSVFKFHNCKGIKYLARLHLGLSHLRGHKFKHSLLWIHFVHVALMLKQICIFSFTTLCSVIKDAPSLAKLMILIALWQTLMIQHWLIFFSLVKLL